MATSPNNPVAIIAKATAADPSYTEGDQVQVSVDLAGNLRTLAELTGSITVTSDATATAAAPSYIEGTANPLSQTLAGNLRVTGVGGTFPVTGTFFQATQPISLASGAAASGSFASGAFASGSHASGSFASGAFASGSVASGAFASGSLATGAMVDLVAEQTPIAAATATATKGLLVGGQYDSTQKTLTTGQQAGYSMSARGALFVAVGADGFAVTNTTATNFNAAVVGTGTAGSPAGNLLTVQGVASMTPVQTTLAPVSTAAAGIVPVVSSSLETGHVIKASAGNLYGLNVTTTTAAGIVQIFNSTTVPAAGAVTPIKSYQVPAASTLVIGFDPPLQCSTGISVAFSSATTPFTKTDSATAFISAEAV